MKKLLVLFVCCLVVSCSEDSQTTSQAVIMTGYKIDVSTSVGYHIMTTGNLINNKLHSETYETITNGISQGATTTQNYFYSNNRLEHYANATRTIYFYYDAIGNLIGGTAIYPNGDEIYYRFVHQSNNTVFCERLNLPYNDVNAMISYRTILEFDANDDVISAGVDYNLDNVMDTTNTFSYANDNLVSISYYSGNVVAFNYSTIINSYSILHDNSFGKKTSRLICSENFSGLNYQLKYSKNILIPDLLLATYQVMTNNYYEIKTETDGQTISTTQFFFE